MILFVPIAIAPDIVPPDFSSFPPIAASSNSSACLKLVELVIIVPEPAVNVPVALNPTEASIVSISSFAFFKFVSRASSAVFSDVALPI